MPCNAKVLVYLFLTPPKENPLLAVVVGFMQSLERVSNYAS